MRKMHLVTLLVGGDKFTAFVTTSGPPVITRDDILVMMGGKEIPRGKTWSK